ncbi:MAG: Gfo/Idh/MocA family oxidoreductase [Rhizobiales bacterium]|nr:Gfo/Idh/MocA family oxidoreductase [Hyphomicrobiales bacterium]
MELRLGIVGCGRISHAHGIAAQRIGKGLRFSACADVNEDAARSFATTYGSNSFYTDYAEMLKKEQLDGVLFATWPAQHREQIETAIKAGARFILCEKALTLTGEEAVEIYDLARKHGVTIVEGFMYTHHPAIAKLDELVRRDVSGAIDSVRASFHLFLPEPEGAQLTWRQRKETGGSVPYDRTCYPVNICARYADALPVKVAASVAVSEKLGTITRLYGEVTYENGRVALIESSNTAVFGQEVQVTCANRIYRLATPFTMPGDGTVVEIEALKFSHVREHLHPVKSPLPVQDDLPSFHAYRPQLENFGKVVSGQAKHSQPLLVESVVNSFTLDGLVRAGLEQRVVNIEIPEHIKKDWRAARKDAIA